MEGRFLSAQKRCREAFQNERVIVHFRAGVAPFHTDWIQGKITITNSTKMTLRNSNVSSIKRPLIHMSLTPGSPRTKNGSGEPPGSDAHALKARAKEDG